MPNLDAAWEKLRSAAAGAPRIETLFAAEPDRMTRFTLEAAGLYLDLSKQPWTKAGLAAALDLARAADLEARREALFAGRPVNTTEGRAALHMALRGPRSGPWSAEIGADIFECRTAEAIYVESIRTGYFEPADKGFWNHVVHIGIGGSDLGPRLVWEALRPLRPDIGVTFVANVDPAAITAALAPLDPARTLVIVVSKSFTTPETLANAAVARQWLLDGVGEDGLASHLAAVSSDVEKAAAFGVHPTRVFAFRDWVGGRFSLWSAVGLAFAIGLGWAAFEELLNGAAAMDRHFVEAPLDQNAPVLLALAHLYNRNILDRRARAVVPYAQRLCLFPAFLQQLEMESNGKPAERPTAGVVFGDAGTNGQHAFFQMLHQGTDIVPVDFIAVREAAEGAPAQQAMLNANAIAQAQALMTGDPDAAPPRRFAGDRPSTMIVLDRLDAASLGALIALYEHKVFVEGAILGINSFDQFGVELGKTLAARVLAGEGGGDPSTTALVARLMPS